MLHRIKNKNVTLCSLCIVLTIGYLLHQLVLAQNKEVETLIQNFIAEQALKNNAVENDKTRKVIKADLNNDSKEDIVVLYSLESFGGTNLHLQYLAVFISSQNNKLQYVTQENIGGKNIRAVELESVESRKINLNTWDYLSTDASCCPSKKGSVQILFCKNKLREIQR